MSKKQKYILTVVGIFAGYCLLVYFIRRSIGVSSSIEDYVRQRNASISLDEIKKEREEIIESAGQNIPDRIEDTINQIVRG